ncbi:MAG: RNA polymerase sigma factor [Acidobacteria bacterium]|jgi:RNA polymerase sigma-70 factor (ECF subfamily)|nr:RNA polymerase sigma factor [Acidobacteriota bacterium]
MEAQAVIGYEPAGMLPAGGTIARQAGLTAWAMEQEILPSIRNKVFCLCRGFIGNSADALDLTQDTMTKALAHYRQDNPEFVQAWVMRIARNLCLDHLRRRKTRGPQQSVSEQLASEWQSPEDLAYIQEDIRIVREAIDKLSPCLRAVLEMREYGEFSYLEIARALGIGRATVNSRLNRARQAVLEYYQQNVTATARTRRDYDRN